MTGGVDAFKAAVPGIIAAVIAGDVGAAVLVRSALAHLGHYDLPIAVRHEGAIFAAIAKKLETPNLWATDWRLKKSIRAKWGTELWKIICQLEGVASRAGLKQLGREPRCAERMAIQIVRLVPSVREFIKDDDNLPFAPKGFHDALKDVKLIREDRREWLKMAPIVQDVSPILANAIDKKTGKVIDVPVAVTAFVLRPFTEGLLAGVTDAVHSEKRPHAPRGVQLQDRSDHGRRHRRRRGDSALT